MILFFIGLVDKKSLHPVFKVYPEYKCHDRNTYHADNSKKQVTNDFFDVYLLLHSYWCSVSHLLMLG